VEPAAEAAAENAARSPITLNVKNELSIAAVGYTVCNGFGHLEILSNNAGLG